MTPGKAFASRAAAALAGAIFATAASVSAAPPVLYGDAFHQSPVRAEPDDLLMIAGSGFAAGDVVVYRRLINTTQPLVHPASVPLASTANEGVAPVVSDSNVPDSLTVRLPAAMLSGRSYALWVLNIGGEWSQGVRINDARPLWITPDVAYRSASLAGLPRQLKVVGRNLLGEPGFLTRVRLRGPAIYQLVAHDDGHPTTALEHYVARVDLPSNMLAGTYTVDVQRDGVSWVALPGQRLTVLADPSPLPTFNVSSYGCSPNDGGDDTACVLKAVDDAALAGGGTVFFGFGRWDLIDPSVQGVDPSYGIVLPVGVSLRGPSSSATTVMKGTDWNARDGQLVYVPVFTVQGRSTVRGIRFEDARSYGPKDWTGPFFQLGKFPGTPDPGPSPSPSSVADVVFTRNVFARPFIAIGDGGLPIRHLYVFYNEFGAYRDALMPAGNRYLTDIKFRVDDSIVVHNIFKPGAYLDTCGHQGTIASEIGASRHLDFSDNVADGHATDYLEGSPRGWRAAFFWHMNNGHEMALVSRNTASCTGDKAGDGEAIAYDNNANTFGFTVAKEVTSASSATVTASTADGYPLKPVQNGQKVPSDYYLEHWVQIADGIGLGQARKIVSYVVDAPGQSVTFTVSPKWDVIPQPGSSRMTVARQYWQVYTVDNTVDIRGCTKDNQNGLRRSGVIGLAGMASDSAVEGNVQFESDGIYLSPSYSGVDDPANGFYAFDDFRYFVEVRGNTILDEVDYDSTCSWGGINLWHGAATASTTPMPPSPVVLGYGVSIARNAVSHADGIRGGAIVFADTWHEPDGSRMYVNTLLHHNVVSNLPAPAPETTTSKDGCQGPFACGDVPIRGVGIHIKLPLNHGTVLYKNGLGGTQLIDNGTDTVHLP